MPPREWIPVLVMLCAPPRSTENHSTVKFGGLRRLYAQEPGDLLSKHRPNFEQGGFWKNNELGLSPKPEIFSWLDCCHSYTVSSHVPWMVVMSTRSGPRQSRG